MNESHRLAEASSPADDIPTEPGTSAKVSEGRPFRRYVVSYAFALMGFFMLFGAVGGILLPNQVQGIEFDNFFTGADRGADLHQLSDLKAQVESGSVTPSVDQQRLLTILDRFESARAQSLSYVQAAAVFVAMFIQPITGVLSDRTRSPWGRRAPWIVGGAVLGTLLLIGLRYSPTIAYMAVFWALSQLLLNVSSVPLTATVADRVDARRIGMASAISGLCSMLGAAVGAVGAGLAFDTLGLDAYYPFALAFVVLAALFVLISRDRSSMQLTTAPMEWTDTLRSFVIPLRDSDFRWVWFAKIVMMFGYSISILYSIYMLQSYVHPALSPSEATKIAPLLQVAALPCMLVAMVVAGRWSDRIGRRKPFVFWTSVLMAASMLVPLVWASVPALFVQAVIAGVALGGYVVVDQALFIDVIEDKKTAGRDLGMASMAGNLGQGIGPIIGGQVVALAGGYRAVWVVAAVVVLAAAAAIIPVKRAR
ncbi:MFS transporter [Nocardia noduli]|uniref:MFS transporter n=1 Tax=Nocardia noduli TaxID=2815722 RepID=UPI001C224C0D|nr:MFS transporter [Nocardia noduli]